VPDIREEFEEYIAGVRERVEARGFEPLGDAIEKWMLHAWQASRAALRVKLPDWEFPHYSEVVEALQQSGIEVKQP